MCQENQCYFKQFSMSLLVIVCELRTSVKPFASFSSFVKSRAFESLSLVSSSNSLASAEQAHIVFLRCALAIIPQYSYGFYSNGSLFVSSFRDVKQIQTTKQRLCSVSLWFVFLCGHFLSLSGCFALFLFFSYASLFVHFVSLFSCFIPFCGLFVSFLHLFLVVFHLSVVPAYFVVILHFFAFSVSSYRHFMPCFASLCRCLSDSPARKYEESLQSATLFSSHPSVLLSMSALPSIFLHFYYDFSCAVRAQLRNM